MPVFNENNNSKSLDKYNNQKFTYSAEKIDLLGASEYTLVTIVADRSGSTSGFDKDMERTVKEIVRACSDSPRAENLLIRFVSFSNQTYEVHGFEQLAGIDLNRYDGTLSPKGSTALYDATINGVENLADFGSNLIKNDYEANGIVFVITDGGENASTYSINDVKKAFASAIKSESLESITTILIGVNEASNDQSIQAFAKDVNFTKFIGMPNVDKKSLAILAQFVSQSISSTSQSLGSGSASQSIQPPTF